MSAALRVLVSVNVALLALTLAVAPATAADFAGLSPGGAITATSLGALTFRSTLFTATCSVTLTGSVSTSIEMPDGEFGTISRGTASGCSGLTSPTVLTGTPWPIAFADVLGGFPDDLTGIVITLKNVAFSGVIAGQTCLYQGDLDLLTPVSGPAPYTLGLFTAVSGSTLSLASRGVLCPASVAVAGTFTLTRMAFAPPRIPKLLVPDDSIVRFHNPVIPNHMFTFTRKVAPAVTGISAFMERGLMGFRVPATECNAVIALNGTCTATVTATPPLISWDLVEIAAAGPVVLGGAWVVP